MLAAIGYAMPEAFRFPGCEGFEAGWPSTFTVPRSTASRAREREG